MTNKQSHSKSERTNKGIARQHSDKYNNKSSASAAAPRANEAETLIQAEPVLRVEPMSPDQVRELILKKTLKNLDRVANQYHWSPEMVSAMHAYLGFLVYGTSSSEEATALLNRRDTNLLLKTVGRRFATSCWYQRRHLGTLVLPGMMLPSYPDDLIEAREFAAGYEKSGES